MRLARGRIHEQGRLLHVLEEFVCDAAVELLTGLDVRGAPRASTALSIADEAAISADEAELG
ncbi:MAG: hypothetical protein JO287_06560 [Pseudonocardiales bacterium]|nr:hypothetical protein [Pseudonocardiales bacterium]